MPDPNKKRTRSPAYPFIGLEEAVRYARVVWDREDRHPFTLEAAAADWELKETSSAVSQVVSALKQFGLLLEEDGNSTRRVRLTDLALDILVSEDEENDPKKDEAIKTAALNPKIHKEIWDKYQGKLPSDTSLKVYLVKERAIPFNKDYVDGFISQFRDTLTFAKLIPADKLSAAGAAVPSEGKQPWSSPSWGQEMSRSDKTQPTAAATATPGPATSPPVSSQPNVRDLPVTLPSLDIAVLRVKVPMSEEDYKALMGALTGMKKSLVKED